MKLFIFLTFISIVFADVSHLKQPSKEYLPPFKPEEPNGYKYPDPTVPTVQYESITFPSYAPSKDIYIPPIRLPLVNEPYALRPSEHSSNTNIRPINLSPIVNSANFPPYYQTTSQHLEYPTHHSTYPNNNYYSNYNNQPSAFIGQNSYQAQQNLKPNSGYIPPTYSPSAVPAFAKAPVAATFPTPTYRPLIFVDPAFGVPTVASVSPTLARIASTLATPSLLPSFEADRYHYYNNPRY